MEIHETKILCDRCGKDITKSYQRKLFRKQSFWFKDTFTSYDLCDECDSSFRFKWLKGMPVDSIGRKYGNN